MLEPKAFANAAAIIAVAASFICWLVTVVTPNLAFSIASSWMHMINLNAVRMSSTASFTDAFIGFATLGAIVWISVYALIALYNKLAK